MKFYQGNIYHIYNRGNNRQKIFFERKNYLFFLQKMRTYLTKYCDILAWCLMPNHFHWMIRVDQNYTPESEILDPESGGPKVEPLNRSVSILLSSYTKAINRRYNRSGSLFQQRTQSIDLSPSEESDDYYPLICFFYIHQNPLKANLVGKLENWEFSSFCDYAGLREGTLCNIKLTNELLELPDDHKQFMELSYRTIPEHLVKKIV